MVSEAICLHAAHPESALVCDIAAGHGWHWGLPMGLDTRRRHHLIGIMGIRVPIINLRWSSDCLRFMMGIPIPVRQAF